jgi:signal transduction histidine kinase
MDSDNTLPQRDREQTDESLRIERTSTDQAIAERRSVIEDDADELIQRTRQEADADLDSARDRADWGVHKPSSAIVSERAREDRTIENERAAADEHLYREREEQARTLDALLPLEREKTDRDLLVERVRSDNQLAIRDDFLGMVTHDLRNLLCGVVLEATALSGAASDSTEGRRTVAAVKRLQQYVARMNRLIGDLVDVVSIDAGKLAVHRLRGDAAALLAEAVGAFAPTAAERGIRLECEIRSHLPLLAAFDHGRMLQVLANLVTNALKFTPRGGSVVIRGETTDDELHISVSDTGTGIPASMLEVVFQRFWQLDKHDQRGLGLGLHISKCIVDAHGGRIWVESKPGEGSSFHLTIPCSLPSSRLDTPVASTASREASVVAQP